MRHLGAPQNCSATHKGSVHRHGRLGDAPAEIDWRDQNAVSPVKCVMMMIVMMMMMMMMMMKMKNYSSRTPVSPSFPCPLPTPQGPGLVR
jgi:hypothetical protein